MVQTSAPQGVESTLLGAAVIRGPVDPRALIHLDKINCQLSNLQGGAEAALE